MVVKVLGLDLSSRECKESGYALLSLNLEIIDLGKFHYNSEILNFITTQHPDLVSIDAPLSFGDKGFRKCEKLMLKSGFRVYPTSIKWMSNLTKRGIYIANKIRRLGIRVIETHPTSSLRAAGFKGNYKSNNEVIQFISKRWNLKVKTGTSRHIVDAVIAAISGIYYLRNKALIFKADDGEIVLASSVSI